MIKHLGLFLKVNFEKEKKLYVKEFVSYFEIHLFLLF